jgi:8-oxo-dGTP pyrophosphatase MutT (NUDIX family)
MSKPWIKHDNKILFENDWFSVNKSNVTTPKNKKSIYTMVHFKNIAASCIPIDNRGNIYLVGQYRFPFGDYSWEIPAGGADPSLDTLTECKRELKEETGLEADLWKEIATMRTSNSVTDEVAKIYACIGLKFGTPSPDETEDLKIRRVSFEEGLRMVMEGEITDSLTMVGIMKLALLTNTLWKKEGVL